MSAWRSGGFRASDESIVFRSSGSKSPSNLPDTDTAPWETLFVRCGEDVEQLRQKGYHFADEIVFDGLVKGGRGWSSAVLIFRDGVLQHSSQYSTSHHNPIIPSYLKRSARQGRAFVIGPCTTSAESRGHGLYPAALDKIVRRQKQAGFDDAYIMTRRENEPSSRGILKAGFEPWKLSRHIRTGPVSRDIAVDFDEIPTLSPKECRQHD